MTLARYVGLPFVDGGRGPGAVDCWGLVRWVYLQELGIDLPMHGETRADDLRGVSRAVDAGKAVMRLPSSGRPGHVGVYDGQGRVLHAEKASGTILERVSSAMIAQRIIGYWRHQ